MDKSELSELLTMGGDARIIMKSGTGVNKYFASPYPRETVTYASSTANDISAEAFAHLQDFAAATSVSNLAEHNGYAAHLEDLRTRIRKAYSIAVDHDIIFSPSGTDLEYVAILVCANRAENGVHNILLGADEVGSGCIHSAHGAYFAGETALGFSSKAGEPVKGLGPVTLTEMPVRCNGGIAHDSQAITQQMRTAIDTALEQGQHPLVHIVHGSKTGLIMPHMDDVDALIDCYGDKVSFVVDACQARITTDAIADYLKRNAIIFLTGSKFMGGPPFSGFAIIPPTLAKRAEGIAGGLTRIFRRAEFPQGWSGRDSLRAKGNAGLSLRLEAAIFELEQFQALEFATVARIIQQFHDVADRLIADMGAHKIRSYPPGDKGEADCHPIEMRTLVTIDLGGDRHDDLDFDRATAIQKSMVDDNVRLGQPVRCAAISAACDEKKHRGTLRVGISMPQITALAEMSEQDAAASLSRDIAQILRAYHNAMQS